MAPCPAGGAAGPAGASPLVYESHYGFLEKPFNLTPDPKYLYLSRRHADAVAHLEFGRRERGGFVVITGEVGTGKTTLARYFLGRLGEQTATAMVLYPALTAAELLRSIVEDLHVPAGGGSLKDLVDSLHRFLLEARSKGRDVVLLIDEAQDLSAEVLEQIRLISNLETETEKLLTIVLIGQSELKQMLDRRELRQLAQRVTARYHLSPLDRLETEDYVRHRIEVAGGGGKVTFASRALGAVHRASGGVPRLINLVCDRSLLAGYVEGVRVITDGMVRRAAREVRGETPGTRRASSRALTASAVVALAAAAVLVGAWLRGVSSGSPGSPGEGASQPRQRAGEPDPGSRTPALDEAVTTLSREASFRRSVEAVEALWGRTGLTVTALRTHLPQVRQLDLPVVLELFHPARPDTCFVALLRLEGERALVSAGGKLTEVATPELDRLWTRQAYFLWSETDATAGTAGQAEAWARSTLARRGYLDEAPDLAGAVSRFQRDLSLVADGIVGSKTLMALYSQDNRSRPRLSAARGAQARPGGGAP